MKPDKIVAAWKGDRRFSAIAKRAAALKKAGKTADEILAAVNEEFGAKPELQRIAETPKPFKIYGDVGTDIDHAAVEQLRTALRLPVAVQGALMPDAHVGYALPVGGVFAAHRAVAPAMVGVDIGCRMHLTVFEDTPESFRRHRVPLFSDLKAVTVFGTGEGRKRPVDHEVLDDPRWSLTNQTRSLRAKAVQQLGTSGSGNHFAELVVGRRISDTDAVPQVFVGLLTHSGSRGVGYAIANYYTKLAAEETARHSSVPRMYEWLDLDTEAGQEYWKAMELAGAFAEANHEVIHRQFAKRSGLKPLTTFQNHHNFAWRDGDLVIHRKGATPAEAGTFGIIPGSMASASYLVEGRGNPDALESASHGAGRRYSRTAAKQSLILSDVKAMLKEKDVLVDGLSIDESPGAYKDIERVMEVQVDAGLIVPVAKMHPIAVIMAGTAGVD